MTTPQPMPGEQLIGSVLGGRTRRRQLDEGGMGTVFEAEHVRFRRSVAVKVMAAHRGRASSVGSLHPRSGDHQSTESPACSAGARLQHHRVNSSGDGALRGRSSTRLEKFRPFAIGPALRIAIQAASALMAPTIRASFTAISSRATSTWSTRAISFS